MRFKGWKVKLLSEVEGERENKQQSLDNYLGIAY